MALIRAINRSCVDNVAESLAHAVVGVRNARDEMAAALGDASFALEQAGCPGNFLCARDFHANKRTVVSGWATSVSAGLAVTHLRLE
jgi:hypothetical protein